MKIALFLDVDKTLTKNYIQKDYATLLGCPEEYNTIEEQYQLDENAKQFGKSLISLFKKKGFTEFFARKHFNDIALLDWTDALLKLGSESESVDTFLVSNGPNYYIEPLAEAYKIPIEHVVCSKYKFDESTDLIDDCEAVDNAKKASFTRDRVPNYDITIGVGDSLKHDQQFLTHCTLGFILNSEGKPIPQSQEASSFFYTTNLARIVELANRLDTIGIEHSTLENDVEITDELISSLTLKSMLNLRLREIKILWGVITTVFFAGLAIGAFFSK